MIAGRLHPDLPFCGVLRVYPFGIAVDYSVVWLSCLAGGAPRYPTDLPKRPFPLMRSVILNSPVDVLITARDGRRLGLTPDSEPVNEIEGAFMYRWLR